MGFEQEGYCLGLERSGGGGRESLEGCGGCYLGEDGGEETEEEER